MLHNPDLFIIMDPEREISNGDLCGNYECDYSMLQFFDSGFHSDDSNWVNHILHRDRKKVPKFIWLELEFY